MKKVILLLTLLMCSNIMFSQETIITKKLIKRNTVLLRTTEDLTLDKEIEALLEKEQHELSLKVQELREVLDTLKIAVDGKNYDNKKYYLPLNKINVTSNYGLRTHPISGDIKFHQGLDLRANYERVKSMISGKVIAAGYSTGYGHYLKIEEKKGYQVLYAHLHNYNKKVGDLVTAGEIIATSGNTGHSTAPHLHIEMKYKGEIVNPLFFINNIKQTNGKPN